jgi:hypothetical protein
MILQPWRLNTRDSDETCRKRRETGNASEGQVIGYPSHKTRRIVKGESVKLVSCLDRRVLMTSIATKNEDEDGREFKVRRSLKIKCGRSAASGVCIGSAGLRALRYP